MDSSQTFENGAGAWIGILEDHFKERRKAFLIFDTDHVLKHISEYASDLLEIHANQIGIMTFSDLFPRLVTNPDMLVDSKPIDVRLNIDQKPGLNGYVIWIELRMREFTSTYRKVSSLKSYSEIKPIFDQFEIGFLILDKNGVVSDLNDHIQHIFRLPGEWIGRNLFTFPPLHQNKLSEFIQNFIAGKNKYRSKAFKIKYSSDAHPVSIQMSGIQLHDLAGNISGALIGCKKDT